MCIIVDANVATELASRTDDAAPVIRWLLRGKGAIILGGHLTTELYRTNFRETLVVLDRAGRLRRQSDEAVDMAAAKIDKGLCKSNDQHVLAAATVSGCRLVFTRDKDLQQDLKNKRLITPKASIYTSKDHVHLLTPCECG